MNSCGWWMLLPWAVLLSGCLEPTLRSPALNTRELPQAREFRQGAIYFHSDAEVSPEHPLFLELSRFPESVCRELRLPISDQLIHVYLFGERGSYEQYLAHRYQDIPSRRALFVMQRSPTGQAEMHVLAFWGDRIQDDLRHELTHATLHSVLPSVPLWLDEGLAMYFECGLAAGGRHSGILQALEPQIQQGRLRLNLERLEGLQELKQMGRADYHEAWAFVHYLLHSSMENRRILLAYLREPQKTSLAGQLRARDAALDQHVTEHLLQLLKTREQWPH